MRRYTWLLIAPVVALAACDQSREELAAALAAQEALAAEKDSLMAEVLEASQFVADVNSQLSNVEGLAEPVATGDDRGIPGPEADRRERQQTLEKVQRAVERLAEAERRVSGAQQRLRLLARNETQLIKQLDEYQATITELRAQMEQRETELTAQIAVLEGRVDTLTHVATALSDTVNQLVGEKHTVYYVAGTKDELIEKGVLVQEGSKFLFFGSRRLEPARDLNIGAFTPLDMRRDTVISLPDTSESYRIVSRQNLEYLDGSVEDGKARGVLRIESPRGFWAPSRYLILVRT